jgi:hypothetical protein
MSGIITVYKTDLGAARQSNAMINGKALKFVAFSVGSGGHNPTTGNPITVNRSNTTLPGKLFGPSYNVEQSIVDETTIQLKCYLLTGEASGTEISNIGIIAQVVSSDTDNGQEFLYAIANFSPISRVPGKLTFTIEFAN